MLRLSSRPNNKSNNDIAMLLFRVCSGILMLTNHGLAKLVKFDVLKNSFYSFLGLGSTLSLVLVLLTEIGCALLLAMGLMTRIASIPLMIAMLVALHTHQWNVFEKGEMAALYFVIFLAIALIGPGKFSVDAMIAKRR